MKIPLKNTFLNIELKVFKTPKVRKLEKELSNYFDAHKIEDIEIKEFKFEKEFDSIHILPQVPYFEGKLSGGDYENDLKEIGKKYGIGNLSFVSFCYHK